MPTIDSHDPGTICWIDLASTDADGATEFYCELFGWTATEPIENAGGYRMLLHEGRQVAGLAPVWGDTDALHVVDVRRERRRRRDLRSRDRERRRGRDGRDGCARRRPHGRPARSGRRAGLGLAAGPAPGLRGARRAGHADLERADDARHRARPAFYARSSAGRRRSRTSTACRTRSGSAASSSSAARSRWTRPGRRTRAALDGLHRDRRLRCHGAALRASSAARSGMRRTTSAPAAARCWRTRRAARSPSSRCARGRDRKGLCTLCSALRSEHAVHRDPHRDPGPARAPGSSARSASSPTPRRSGCRSSSRAPRAPSSPTSTATRSSTSQAASAAWPSGTPTPRSRARCTRRSRASCTPTSRSCRTTPTSSWPSGCASGCRSRGPTKAAFFNTGAEAVENAVKIARAATGRPAVIAYEGAFHGRTLMAMSLTSKQHPYKAGFGPFAPEVYRVAFPTSTAGRAAAMPPRTRSTRCGARSRRASTRVGGRHRDRADPGRGRVRARARRPTSVGCASCATSTASC